MTSAHLGLGERERGFALRAAALVGGALRDRHGDVGVVSVSVDDALGERSTLRVELVMRLTPEEALRLRYGDDVEIERTARGFRIVVPETPGDRQAPGPE